MMIAIGVDVGGTYTRVGALCIDDRTGIDLAIRCCTTVGDEHGDALIDWVARGIAEVVEEAEAEFPSAETAADDCARSPRVAGVGLALPGILDHSRRRLVRSVNVPFLEGRPIADELAERTGYPVRLVTDAEAAAWAEYAAYMSGKPIRAQSASDGLEPTAQRFVHLRIGTGIGCGLVVNGELQRLDRNHTGHLDVLKIDDGPNAPDCPCGQRGCLETIASGRVLRKRALKLYGHARARDATGPRIVPPPLVGGVPRANARNQGSDPGRHGDTDSGNPLATLQQKWKEGDYAARAIVEQASNALAIACQSLIDRFAPEVISIGGGVSAALPCLLEEAARLVNSNDTAPGAHSATTILPATQGDKAGIIGAALLVSSPTSATA